MRVIDTNPTDEPMTSGLPVIRAQSLESLRFATKLRFHLKQCSESK